MLHSFEIPCRSALFLLKGVARQLKVPCVVEMLTWLRVSLHIGEVGALSSTPHSLSLDLPLCRSDSCNSIPYGHKLGYDVSWFALDCRCQGPRVAG